MSISQMLEQNGVTHCDSPSETESFAWFARFQLALTHQQYWMVDSSKPLVAVSTSCLGRQTTSLPEFSHLLHYQHCKRQKHILIPNLYYKYIQTDCKVHIALKSNTYSTGSVLRSNSNDKCMRTNVWNCSAFSFRIWSAISLSMLLTLFGTHFVRNINGAFHSIQIVCHSASYFHKKISNQPCIWIASTEKITKFEWNTQQIWINGSNSDGFLSTNNGFIFIKITKTLSQYN